LSASLFSDGKVAHEAINIQNSASDDAKMDRRIVFHPLRNKRRFAVGAAFCAPLQKPCHAL
jgi:hypothetical protein